MMNSNPQNKLQKDRNQKILLELASLPGNNICADCKTRMPRWASHSLGIFICVNCASIHRKIGTHITKVKSLTMDDWTKDQIEFMKSMGNVKSNSIYNPNELRHPPPPNLEETERDSEIEQYIRAKYEYRKFIDKSALVASKLGPSRSAASVAPRSVSSPLSSSTQASPPSQPAPPPSAPPRPLVTATDAAATSLAPRLASGSNQASEYPAPTSYYAQNQRSMSHPVPVTQAQHLQQAQRQNTIGGVSSIWDDLNSIAGPVQNSTLPLQYQSSPSFSSAPKPHVNGAIGAQGYPVGVTSAGMGMNPFQSQQIGTNPYSQQQSQSPFAPAQMSSPFSQTTTGTSPAAPSYAQFQASSNPMLSQSTSGTFMQPQAQATLQIQSPVGQSYLSASPSQGFMTPSVSQPQFLSHSPSQPFLSPSPSQQFLSHSPQPQVQQQPPTQGQFGYQSPMSASSAQFGAMGASDSGQSQFLGMTTMQMQQQLLLQQQQQQQMQQQMQQQQMQQQMQTQQQQQLAQQGMFTASQPQMMYGQMFPQSGSYSAGTQQQWGAM
ncbi:UBA domain-containing protein 3 [Psilocybe cubensis]|uniref:UBA domain-containing protein 3 n=2 Tax=Psilocybe cubensis TaxID=181762 RepID=A0ACB8GG66_PSICU|nr:UBA domain-containing protein 3 [Psilocybe cubensis]KAH9474609.1 UBA domain-containing protein 3 [Psilocybe cubensis]